MKKQEKEINKKGMLKYTIILKILSILITTLLIGLGIYGILFNFQDRINNIIKPYSYTGGIAKYDEFVFEPSNKVEETEAYIDKEGNVVRKVPKNLALPNINLPKDANVQINGENPYQVNGEKKEPIDKEASEYKVEKRKFPDNEEKNVTKENIEKSQEILIKKLVTLGYEDIRISKDEKTGKIVFKIPQERNKNNLFKNEDFESKDWKDRKNKIESLLLERGGFELKDPETGKVYISEKNLKSTEILKAHSEGVFIEFKLDEEGKKILSDISRKYVVQKENKEEKENKEIRYDILLEVGGKTLLRAPFAEPNDSGVIQLRIISPEELKDQARVQKQIEELYGIKTSLEYGKSPIIYEVTGYTEGITPEINEQGLKLLIYIAVVIIAVLPLILIVKYRVKGLLASLVLLSFLSVYLLFIRMTDILLTIPAAVAILVIYILEFIVIFKTLKEYEKDGEFNEIYNVVDTIAKTFILVVMAILLSFSNNKLLASTGMVIFVGQILLLSHNFMFMKGNVK